MKLHFRSQTSLYFFIAGLTLSPVPAALAQQEAGQVEGPSKYLVVTNVELKPDQRSAFAKIEGEEVAALRAADVPGHYIAMWPITGGNDVLYFHGFDSFADMQEAHDKIVAKTQLEDTLKADNAAEAPLVAARRTSIYSYDKDLSLNAPVDLSKMRFMRVLLFHVRSGDEEDFERLVKLFVKAYQSTIPDARWAMFKKTYGVGSDNTYILVTPMDSLSVVDVMGANDKKFREAVGEDQVHMLVKGLTDNVESSESDLFALGAEISYVPASWISSSPDFWGKK